MEAREFFNEWNPKRLGKKDWTHYDVMEFAEAYGEHKLSQIKIRSKRPIDIAIIDSVYDSMIKYQKCQSKNQNKQLSLSCDMIKEILTNAF
jgi:hypothetical protein